MFSFVSSPIKKPSSVQRKVPVVPEEVPVLSLDPFLVSPKLIFEGITVGCSATRKLIIKNSFKHDIQLFFTKIPPSERNVMFNCTTVNVPSENEFTLEMTWVPSEECACRDTITLEDGIKIKKHFYVIFKSVKLKKKEVKKKVKRSGKNINIKVPQTSCDVQAEPKKMKYSDKENISYNSEDLRRETYTVQSTRALLPLNSIEYITPVKVDEFNPSLCSTGHKSDCRSRTFTISTPLTDSAKNVIEANLWCNIDSKKTETKVDREEKQRKYSIKRKLDWTDNAGSSEIKLHSNSDDTGYKSEINIDKSTTRTASFIAKLDIIQNECFSINRSPSLSIDSNDSSQTKVSELKKRTYAKNVTTEDYTKQEIFFKNWLNMLLVQPFNAQDIENIVLESKLLKRIRTKAQILYKSTTQNISRKISENKILEIKYDDVHINVEYQNDIVSILLRYNILFLHLALESVFNSLIKCDINVLSGFLIERLFKDLDLLKKFRSVHSFRYALEMKKHILKNVLILIFFMEQLKLEGVLKCRLYRKDSDIKSSIDILKKFLFTFCKYPNEALKFLQSSGYCLKYNQTALDEYNYKTENLCYDLRDGVKLAKAAEIIYTKSFIPNLRVPAISRLQKIHNMEVVFERFDFKNETVWPRDIVDGNQEKTLLVLRKIYNCDAPRRVKAATLIQKWWRKDLYVLYNRVQKLRLYTAALTIQNFFRKNFLKKIQAANVIQNYYRSYKQRKWFRTISFSIIIFQSFARKRLALFKRELYLRHVIFLQKNIRCFIRRRKFIALKHATIFIQRKYKATIIRKRFLAIKTHATVIQNIYRTKLIRNKYLNLKNAAIFIQKNIRCVRQKRKYERIKAAVVVIQRYWRSYTLRKNFFKVRHAAVVIQRAFRAYLEMKRVRNEYKVLKETTIWIQKRYRANREMRARREEFSAMKSATIYIQNKFRAQQKMLHVRRQYLNLRHATIRIQRKFKGKRAALQAAFIIQRKFRAYTQMKIVFNQFINLRRATILIQRRWLAEKVMRKQRQEFIHLRNTTVWIQRKFRATKRMKFERKNYLLIKRACVFTQRWFRSKQMMLNERKRFLNLKRAVIFVETRRLYLQMLRTVIYVQNKYRAKIVRTEFLRAVNTIQRKLRFEQSKLKDSPFGGNLLMRLQALCRGYAVRQKYNFTLRNKLKRKISATKIQAAWRGYNTRKLTDKEFVKIRQRYKIAEATKLPEKILAFKRDLAIQHLDNEFSTVFQINKSLEDIEYVIRRCKDTCLKMSFKLPTQLYKIITSTSRSLPEMKLSTYATSILISFVKYQPSAANAYVATEIQNVLTVMVNWCDKEGMLFPYLCTLLWHFANTRACLRHLKKLPNLKRTLNKMDALCERKRKMVLKGSYKGQSVFAPYKKLPLPAVTPDWGLDFKTRPRTFTNSTHAVKTLLNVFGEDVKKAVI